MFISKKSKNNLDGLITHRFNLQHWMCANHFWEILITLSQVNHSQFIDIIFWESHLSSRDFIFVETDFTFVESDFIFVETDSIFSIPTANEYDVIVIFFVLFV